MTRREAVEDFLAQKELALVGASRSGRKFGNTLCTELAAKGYVVHLVHPEAREIAGVPCVPTLADLPTRVGGLVLAVAPQKVVALAREAAEAGIRRIWVQQGSASPEAIRLCEEKRISLVHGECLLMFASPRGIHALHRWLWGALGKLPA